MTFPIWGLLLTKGSGAGGKEIGHRMDGRYLVVQYSDIFPKYGSYHFGQGFDSESLTLSLIK